MHLRSVQSNIINFVAQRPALRKAAIGVGRGLNLLFKNYTPGLTTEAYLLAQNVRPYEAVEVRDGGFYVNEERRVTSACLSKKLIGVSMLSIPFNEMNVGLLEPANLAQDFRSVLHRESFLSGIRLPLDIAIYSLILDQGTKFTAVPISTYHLLGQSLVSNITQGSLLLIASLLYYCNIRKICLLDKVGVGLYFGGVCSNLSDLVFRGFGVNYLYFGDLMFNYADLFTLFGLTATLSARIAINLKESNFYHAFLYSCAFAGFMRKAVLDMFF